jgi:phage-related protein
MLPNDPIMLLSAVNMKLRDQYPSLDALCEDMDVDKDEIARISFYHWFDGQMTVDHRFFRYSSR